MSSFAATLTLVYAWRPEALAAITLLPAWSWLLLGLPGLLLLRGIPRGPVLLFFLAWGSFVALHVEEPRSLARSLIQQPKTDRIPGTLRLVSLNCAGGQVAALHDLEELQPDIVFLQESPSRREVDAFAGRLFGPSGSSVYDGDTSILARGRLVNTKKQKREFYYSHGTLALTGLGELDLVSLRLWPATLNFDLWNLSCWQIHMQHRQDQIHQIRNLAPELPFAKVRIVAGDFNAPQGDPVYRLLPQGLYDTFGTKGLGLGNTLLNDFPALRIDQIWVSRSLKTVQSFTRRGSCSDHRIVVSDVSPESP